MRRPALYRPTPDTGWSHPYTGLVARAVFYNDGGQPPAVPPAPTPANMPGTPANPAPPAAGGEPGGNPPMVQITQDRLSKMMAAEKDDGRRSALRSIATAAGLDPDTVDLDPAKMGSLLKQAQEAERQRMTEVERREADAAAAAEKAGRELAAAQAMTRAASLQMTLMGLGAAPGVLGDVTAILRNDLANVDNPTDDQIREAAEKLKARRPGDFGAQAPAAPGTPPPAPAGTPAGGPPSRQTPSGKPGDRGREMALRRGHLKAS
ncbi:hypothetical protein OG552_10415 [Streptomyces sp. NBC_01476]|uniref:hypothetical protein n=1 Tax=Streptomyces sp. NBC_01476 TaxID=2903881 RepID=UPI002E376BF1|nr:hypothetical protein [Streptomyces sp. NBC_01476]